SLGLSVEEQQRDVGERAGTEAPPDGEVHDVAQPPALPLEVKDFGRDGGEAVFRAPTAASRRAHEELAARARHVDGPPVGADHTVAPPVHLSGLNVEFFGWRFGLFAPAGLIGAPAQPQGSFYVG